LREQKRAKKEQAEERSPQPAQINKAINLFHQNGDLNFTFWVVGGSGTPQSRRA
jgi:hypothetical protein